MVDDFIDLEPLDVLNLEDESDIEPSEQKIRQKLSSAATNHYVNSFFPVLFVNRKMKILFANKACKHLFNGFFELDGHYFIDVFGKSFGIDEIRKMHDTIIDGRNGYFWKSEVHIKSRNHVSMQIKVDIFPAILDEKEPSLFIVKFDDVTEENKQFTRNNFIGLLAASQLKDNDTGNHIVRVNFYSSCIAQNLLRGKNPKYKRIDTDFIDNIGFLAAMHDVGKIGTPDDILHKEGPLSDMEWTIMREHTKNGAYILSPYPNPMAKEIALSHHERWDGSGYPYQLSGEMIPLAARIVTIADVYDALRMERSYKSAMNHEAAVKEMFKGNESHFDPFLMEVFVSCEADFRRIYDDNLDLKHGSH